MDFPPPPEGAMPLDGTPPPVQAVTSSAQPSAGIPAPPAGAQPLDTPPPPAGAVPFEDTVPQQKSPEKTNTEVPGFWSAVGSAFTRGFEDNVNSAISGAQAVLPTSLGGKSIEQQYQEGLLQPETHDEITRLQQQSFWDGMTDPKWWGVHIAGGIGGSLPGLGTGVLASSVGGGAPGFVGGVAGETGLSTLVPAYKAARAAGLDPDAAVKRALIDSGIAAAGAAAMGVAPGVSVFGKETLDGVVNVMKRPALEALAQIGLVQPLIGDTAQIATTLSHGEVPTVNDLVTSTVDNIGMGAAMVGAHAMLGEAARAAKLGAAPQTPASPVEVQQSFENQNPASTPLPQTASKPEASAAPTPQMERELYPKEDVFFSTVKQTIQDKIPDRASGSQILATLRNTPGVKEEELNNLNLPNYLEGLDGKVNKADLLAHVEANQLQLEEVHRGTPTEFAATSNPPTENLGAYAQYILPGPSENYREILLKTPARGIAANDEENFNGSHWQEPNVLAHARVTDRLTDGKRTLHIEEIQSDVHQTGRKIGYKPSQQELFELGNRVLATREAENNFFDNNKEAIANDPAVERQWNSLRAATDAARANYQDAATKDEFGVPQLPFKTSWPELTVKRLLRFAADNGYERISWANGDQVGLRQGSYDELQGSKEFYDKIIPSIMKKWAKKLAMGGGTTRLYDRAKFDPLVESVRAIPSYVRSARMKQLVDMGLRDNFNDRNGYIDVSPAAGERIRRGLPLYEESTKFEISHSAAETPEALDANYERLKNYRFNMGKMAKVLADRVGLKGQLEVKWVNGGLGRSGRARGSAEDLGKGKYRITINIPVHSRPEELYSTFAHEFGHVVMWSKFEHASDSEKQAIFASYEGWRKGLQGNTVGDVYTQRDNAVASETGYRNTPNPVGAPVYNDPLSSITNASRNYLHSFNEWFAEQVARWATTDDKPLSLVDKFFKRLGTTIRDVVSTFAQRSGLNPKPTEVMQKWLDSLHTDTDPNRQVAQTADIKDKLEFDSQRQNAAALDRDGTPEVPSTPQTASTGGGRNIVNSLPPSAQGPGKAMAAHADRMNKFWEWMTSLPQVASLNKHVRGLQVYSELASLMNVEKNNILSAAKNTLDFWKKLADPKQQVALGKFIDDYKNMLYKDPANTNRTSDRPTQKEFADLVAKHGLSSQALAVFNRVVKDFDGFLEGYRDLLHKEADRIRDPKARQDAKDNADIAINKLKNRPYMPSMHFGNFTITVYDAKGNVRHFETAETARRQRQIAAELSKHSNLLPGDQVKTGFLAKDVGPMRGMPTKLLDLMDQKLKLSTTQRAALDQLRFEYAPAQSFKHRFQSKDLTPGYSTDWQRAYANFFFHGANHLMRVKYADKLQDAIEEVEKESKARPGDTVKLDKIRNFMAEHRQMLLDPKPDFAALRGLMFHWYLGFNPASATLNLSQTAIMTYPHLASKFGGLGKGDLAAAAAILKAGKDLNNFYKKGNLVERAEAAKNLPGPEGSAIRALGEAVKEGIITETQAHVLAAISENRNLLRAFGTKAEDFWWKFSNASSWMFEMTEQFNRRVAFRAAHELAMRDPNNVYVQEMVRDNPLQYQRLRDQGWSHQEAAAFVAAKDTVDKTQFTYAPYNRPKFMQGRKSAYFIFKSFTQNTLFNFYNNPAAAARSLLILGAMGGLMGLPGAEDVNSIVKAIARWLGSDFDPADEARKFAIDVTHGNINPDMLLHGTSVKGFGIPAVVDALGHLTGAYNHAPLPVLDRSGSVSMGNILPFDLGALLSPQKDVKGTELQQLAKASGAGFGLGFALYNFVQNVGQGKGGELKTWEGIMPRVLNNASHVFRWATQGAEVSGSGAAVTRFNITDTEQAAEILARAMGYQPRRLTAQYEAGQAKNEAAAYWDLRKQLLMRQFAAAIQGKDPEEKARVVQSIRNFNQMLPDEWKPKAITAQALRESITAKFRDQQRLEAGVALAKQNVKGFKSLDKYYPDAKPAGAVGVQPVR